MEEILKSLIDSIMDAIEEFFNALIIPTVSFTKDAFIVSLVFLAWSIFAEFAKAPALVNWQEALTCTILLLFIVLIDGNTRSSIKDSVIKVKDAANMFYYTGESEQGEEILNDDEQLGC